MPLVFIIQGLKTLRHHFISTLIFQFAFGNIYLSFPLKMIYFPVFILSIFIIVNIFELQIALKQF